MNGTGSATCVLSAIGVGWSGRSSRRQSLRPLSLSTTVPTTFSSKFAIAWNFFPLQSCIDAQAVDDVDGRDHRAVDPEALLERRQRRRPALPPEPDRRRAALAFLL